MQIFCFGNNLYKISALLSEKRNQSTDSTAGSIVWLLAGKMVPKGDEKMFHLTLNFL